jgi:hypothetical protein
VLTPFLIISAAFSNLLNRVSFFLASAIEHLLKREHPPVTERISLTEECGWKEGDRGGSAEGEQTDGKKKAKVCLDINRPSDGRTWLQFAAPSVRDAD